MLLLLLLVSSPSLSLGCQVSTNIPRSVKRLLSPVRPHISHVNNKVSSVDSLSVMSRVTDQDSLWGQTLFQGSGLSNSSSQTSRYTSEAWSQIEAFHYLE